MWKPMASDFCRRLSSYEALARYTEAKQVLIGLSRLTEEDPDAAGPACTGDRSADELNDKTIGPEQYSLVKRALSRAEELRSQGKAEEARTLLQTIVDMYATDPDAATFVEQARNGLAP